jgi:hypothetical protein
VVVYEPGVSIDGSIPLGWIEPHRERLAAGDPPGSIRGDGSRRRRRTARPRADAALVCQAGPAAPHQRAMQAVIPNCTTEVIAGLDHLASDKAPATVAKHVLRQRRT